MCSDLEFLKVLKDQSNFIFKKSLSRLEADPAIWKGGGPIDRKTIHVKFIICKVSRPYLFQHQGTLQYGKSCHFVERQMGLVRYVHVNLHIISSLNKPCQQLSSKENARRLC